MPEQTMPELRPELKVRSIAGKASENGLTFAGGEKRHQVLYNIHQWPSEYPISPEGHGDSGNATNYRINQAAW